MIVSSRRQQFMAVVRQRLDLATRDVAATAKRNLGGGGALTGSVRAVRAGRGVWRVGSNHPGAMAQERGAYIQPRNRKALKFNGRYSMRARIPAKHWLERAGSQWAKIAGRRLRGG